jgi:hypothetical protein
VNTVVGMFDPVRAASSVLSRPSAQSRDQGQEGKVPPKAPSPEKAVQGHQSAIYTKGPSASGAVSESARLARLRLSRAHNRVRLGG